MAAMYRVYEICRDGLPTFVGAAKDGDTPAVGPLESLRWPLASVTLEEWAARRIAAARVRQIVEWCGCKPPWLRNRLAFETPAARPIECEWPDGRVERFATLQAAATAAGVSMAAICKRIIQARPDRRGRRWRDTKP